VTAGNAPAAAAVRPAPVDSPGAAVRAPFGAVPQLRWSALALTAGLAVLYVPTYRDLAAGPWQTDAASHGPFVALLAAWLLWRKRHDVVRAAAAPADLPGLVLLVLGLLLYVVGRAVQVAPFEVASQIPVLAAIVLLLAGRRALRVVAFPLMFLAFTIPLPGFLVEALTGALKEGVSASVEEVLALGGLPVARSGVVLTLGQYQLLLADACSGLHSLFSLSALGLLYLHLAGRPGRLHQALLVAAILPVAFIANVARVLALALITYGFGDAAGQGFLHDLAGLSVFVVALVLLYALDAMLCRVLPSSSGNAPR